MKRKSKFILRILASTVSVVLLASAFPFPSSELTTADAAQTTTISNPIIWADVPDEDIIRVGDTYYMVIQSGCPDHEIKRFGFMGDMQLRL